MTKKTKVDLITSISLIIASSIVMLLPILNVKSVKIAYIILMGIYVVSNLINYLLIKESKDKEGLYTAIVSIISIALLFILNISSNPLNLALVLLIWIFGMSLVKLKKADYYHDRNNNIWAINSMTLCIFILIGLLTTINLYYSSQVQVLMIGNFFFINGILDLVDPITNFIREKN